MAANGFKCDLCNIMAGNQVSFDSHIIGNKHQRALHKKAQQDRYTKCGVFVTGFTIDLDQEDIIKALSKYGKLNEHFFDASKRFLICQFKEASAAHNALNAKIKVGKCSLVIRPRISKNDNPVTHQNPNVKKMEDYERIKQILVKPANFDIQLEHLIMNIQLPRHVMFQKYNHLCRDIQNVLSFKFPKCVIHPFGSTLTGLGFINSDVDIFVQIQENKTPHLKPIPSVFLSAECIKITKKILFNSRFFTNIYAIPKARTPIIKCLHTPTGVNCDLNFKNMLGVCNSNLIKFLLASHVRFNPAMIIIKYWARKHEVTGVGKMTNYCLVMLFIFYLQQCEKPLLPSVSSLQTPDCTYLQNKWNGGFCSDLKNLYTITYVPSVQDLVCGFFNFYSTFDYGLWVISPLTGCSVAKTYFLTPEKLPVEFNHYKTVLKSDNSQSLPVDTPICVQDPFVLSQNLTNHLRGRILKDFQILCENSASFFTCKPSNHFTILYNLLFVIEKPKHTLADMSTDEMCMFRIPFNSNMIYTQIETDLEEKPKFLTNLWFDKLQQFVQHVLVKVMLFNVEIKKDRPLRKSLKLEGQSDIHDTNEIDSISFRCKAYCNVWDGRKGIAKTFDTINKKEASTLLEKEIMVSNYIANVHYKGITFSDPIEFDLTIVSKVNPTEARFDLKKVIAKKNRFKIMADSIAHKFPIWFDRHLRETNYKEMHSSEMHLMKAELKAEVVDVKPISVDTVVVKTENEFLNSIERTENLSNDLPNLVTLKQEPN